MGFRSPISNSYFQVAVMKGTVFPNWSEVNKTLVCRGKKLGWGERKWWAEEIRVVQADRKTLSKLIDPEVW